MNAPRTGRGRLGPHPRELPWHHEALPRAVGAADDHELAAAIAARPAEEVAEPSWRE